MKSLNFTLEEIKELYTFCHIARSCGDNRANKFLELFGKYLSE